MHIKIRIWSTEIQWNDYLSMMDFIWSSFSACCWRIRCSLSARRDCHSSIRLWVSTSWSINRISAVCSRTWASTNCCRSKCTSFSYCVQQKDEIQSYYCKKIITSFAYTYIHKGKINSQYTNTCHCSLKQDTNSNTKTWHFTLRHEYAHKHMTLITKTWLYTQRHDTLHTKAWHTAH